MKRYGLYGGLVLLAIVNLLVLAGVRLNRSGEPDASVELTERELSLNRIEKENSGVSLRLDLQQYGDRESEWFDKKKLTEVGFDCSTPVDAADAGFRYRKALPRKTFVVLEYEGKAWEAWQARESKELEAMEAKISKGEVARKELTEAKKRYAWELVAASRLFPVDVGNDPKKLRVTYPDRHRFIITPAKVRLHFHGTVNEKGKPIEPARLKGSIDDILTDTVQVPRDKQGLLRTLQTKGQSWQRNYYEQEQNEKPMPPRFKAVLNFGQRYEPWVVAVRP